MGNYVSVVGLKLAEETFGVQPRASQTDGYIAMSNSPEQDISTGLTLEKTASRLPLCCELVCMVAVSEKRGKKDRKTRVSEYLTVLRDYHHPEERYVCELCFKVILQTGRCVVIMR